MYLILNKCKAVYFIILVVFRSNKRRELYSTFSPEEQELFDELQQEIDMLRKLLAKRDKKAAEKVR
jgi:hypothetical protein